MSSVMSCSSSSSSPITWASTSRQRWPRPSKNTKRGLSGEILHYLSTGLLHCLLGACEKSPATNVPSGRLKRRVVFLCPRPTERGLRRGRESTGSGRNREGWWMTAIVCSLAVLDTVERRRYDAANLYLVLDRIVKPHI